MHISWHGLFTVKIQSQDTTLILDPYGSGSGLIPLRSKADIVALTNPQDESMSNVASIQGEPQIINTPGEYSISGFMLHALPWRGEDGNERSFHRWDIEDISILHVGALNRDLTNKELEILEEANVDILLLPVGGGDSLNTKQALHLLTTIEPRLVIPINFRVPKLKKKLEDVDQFAKEMGTKPSERQPKLIVKKKNLPEDELQTVLLSP